MNLPELHRIDGMKVVATVRIREDVGSIRMVGEMVEILEIARR